MASFLIWFNILFYPPLQLQFEGSQVLYWQGIVELCTPVSKAELGKITSAPIGLIKSNTPSAALPCTVAVVCGEPSMQIEGSFSLESLVDQHGGLVHY